MPDLLMEKDGPVVVLTLNRPARRNAMTLAMFARLADAWDEIDADTDVRACILTGAGEHFSAGMDLRAMAGDVDDGDDYDVKGRMEREGSDWIYDGLLKTRHPRVPVIAAVEGNAIAGGRRSCRGPRSGWRPRAPPSGCPRPAGPSTREAVRPYAWHGRCRSPWPPTSSSPEGT